MADGSAVTVIGTVTAVSLDGYFYIESSDRSSGIRVAKTGVTPAVGSSVTAVGNISTLDSGERYIVANQVSGVAGTPLAPVAMNNAALGGSYYDNPSSCRGQVGVEGGFGVNNIGLYVRTSGKVTTINDTMFALTDGSGVSVTVTCPWDNTPDNGDYVIVTGISSYLRDAFNNVQRRIIVMPVGSVDCLIHRE